MSDQDVDGELRSWDGDRDGLAKEVRRVADRLRGLSLVRLAAEAPPHTSRAAAARDAAQTLALAAQGMEERHRADEPVWRVLPALEDFAAGDELAVTGQDLLSAAAPLAADEPVWAPGGRRTAQQVFAAAAAQVAELRRLL